MSMQETVYGKTARFDTGRAMTEDELFEVAPSVFAEKAHGSRSEKFRPIPTIEVVRGLADEGYSVVGARQSSTKPGSGRREFTKHLLRIRQLDAGKRHCVGDTVLEMLLKNANDGTCAYDLMAALFRISCLNSLVVMLQQLDAIRVRHSGDVVSKVKQGTDRVLSSGLLALEAPKVWPEIQLEPKERMAFATSAHSYRFSDSHSNVQTTVVPPEALLVPRREEDEGKDLWSVFNVVQENCLKGGVKGTRANGYGATTAPIKEIDRDLKLNRALWMLAAKMQELKSE